MTRSRDYDITWKITTSRDQTLLLFTDKKFRYKSMWFWRKNLRQSCCLSPTCQTQRSLFVTIGDYRGKWQATPHTTHTNARPTCSSNESHARVVQPVHIARVTLSPVYTPPTRRVELCRAVCTHPSVVVTQFPILQPTRLDKFSTCSVFNVFRPNQPWITSCDLRLQYISVARPADATQLDSWVATASAVCNGH